MFSRGFQTIQISSRVLAHGELVELFSNGEALVRDGEKLYRGRPITVNRSMAPVRAVDQGPQASFA